MKVRRLEWITLGVILLVATIARFYRLNASLWYDEIVTLIDFVRLPTRELIATYSSTNNHMLYSLEAQATIAVFSESAWALRLPAVLFGLASLVAVWALARRAVGRTQALVTVFLLAISYHHVWFSQDARGYTGLLFWTTCATVLFVQGLASPRWRTWTLYALCVAAAAYTHLSALFFFAGHGMVYLALLVLSRRRREIVAQHAELAGVLTPRPAFGFLLGGLLTLLLNIPIAGQVMHAVAAHSASAVNEVAGLAEWRNPLRTVREVSTSMASAGPLLPAILVASIVTFGVGVVRLARQQPVITAIYVLHVPIATAILLAVHSRIWPRYFFVDIGFIYVAVVHGTFLLCTEVSRRFGLNRRWPQAGGILATAAIAVMTAGSLWLLARNYAYPKQDVAGAVAFVERERGPGDAVALFGDTGMVLSRYYAPHWTSVSVDRAVELDALRALGPGTWVVLAFPNQYVRGKPQFAMILQEGFDRVAVFPGTLGNGVVWVYRSRAR